MISKFCGNILEQPITKKEWNLRWSRANKEKMQLYNQKEMLCVFCNKNIKVCKKSIHVKSTLCIKNQLKFIDDFMLRNNLFTLNINDREIRIKYLYEKLCDVKYNLEKFESMREDIINQCKKI